MTRYELLDRIGVGGMAEIFRGKAVAAGGFEKPVAIKRILPHLSQDQRFVELLIAEAKVLSLLRHRNIVQIFDVGLGDDGQYFLVMEYVDGKDLGAVQRGLEACRRRMPFDLALHIVAEICEALEHAHSARAPDGKGMSLVHRDVSPSNVLMSRAGEIKLTDFGIAKRAEQEPTRHEAVRGKFAYISPEQARNEHVEPRSDVFSAGILLWELVTNRRLFSGLGPREALRGVREAQVPRPREIDRRLTPEIDDLVMSALARDARSRPTAGQLGGELRALRYSLEVTVVDPATELAKIIDAAEAAERQRAPRMAPPPSVEFDGNEPTVIRIQTAGEFSVRDQDGTSVARARSVIDRFEEEETRQAQLSYEPMAVPWASAGPDPHEPTQAREPLSAEDGPIYPPRTIDPDLRVPDLRVPDLHVPDLHVSDPHVSDPHFDADEVTILVTPSNRRTPSLARSARSRPATQPPEPLGRTPALGTVHDHGGLGVASPPLPPGPSAMAPPPLPLPASMAPLPRQPLPLALPPVMLAPPPSMAAPPRAGNYPIWGMPPHLPMPGSPRTPLKPWMLAIGAIVMASLGFAVTRACIHSTTSASHAEAK